MASIHAQKAFLGSVGRDALAQRQGRPAAGRQRMQVQARAAVKSKSKASAMVCIDCGYIYDGSQGPFESLPTSYRCPVCAAPKRRFKALEGASRGNDTKSMQARRAKLRSQAEERGESVEEDFSFLYATAGVTVAALAAFAFFALNR